ncbi:PRCC domain-containing protein [Sporobolomyces salmoneus]|uniref:PRCC domain-containing protein n=1 Tax=Sporobolomyces salmoneus TaxID=183962 RepID=UPI003171F165
MGLVDYGSDSDSASSPPPSAAPSIKPSTTSSTSSSSLLNLPPPKSSLNLPAPSTSSSTNKPILPLAGKKKEKGPVRIVLDLPSAQSDQDDDGPAKKKPRLALGKGTGLSGLAAMLPKPKNEVAPPPPSSATASSKPVTNGVNAGLGDMFGAGAGTKKEEEIPSMFAPPSVRGKGKGKATSYAAPEPEPEPAVDFFGIGSVTSSLSTSSSSKPTVSSAPSISSAPTLREPPTSSSRQPTASDPYPGFTQLPSGEWVAKDQETYELALKWQAEQQAQSELPRGFEEKEIENKGGYKDVDEAKRAKDAWATRPSQVPGQEEEFKKSAQIKGIPKQASQQARRKGQLSSLIAEAHDNRAELEERIAQARLNRKSAGNKYGF